MRVAMPSALAAMLLAITACAPVPQVQTAVAPDAGLDRLRTFRVVLASNYVGDVLPGETRPAFVNSTTSKALGKEIAVKLERRGYAANNAAPDVLFPLTAARKGWLGSVTKP